MGSKSFSEEVAEYTAKRRAIDNAVLSGAQDAPPCFTCKAPSTHVTDRIIPAGYCAYQCAAHVPERAAPLWGSDPGWSTNYIEIEAARSAFAARGAA